MPLFSFQRRSEPITHRPLPLREKVVEDGGWGKIWTGQAVGLTFLSLRRRILEPPQVGAPRQVCDPRQVRYQRQVRATHSRCVLSAPTPLSRQAKHDVETYPVFITVPIPAGQREGGVSGGDGSQQKPLHLLIQ